MMDELAWYFNFPCSELKERTFERKETPLASRVVQGDSGPSPSCVWNPRVFPKF